MRETKTMTKEPKEGSVRKNIGGKNMSEDLNQKQRRLTKELAKVKALTAQQNNKVKKNRDMTVGLPTDNSHKAMPSSNDNPDVILLPSKKRGKKENIPF